ncbi:MAG: hypothetical protein IKX48_17915 [Victivallales bacterium]|nr:hypothetical protein [Victivallales bacterium]
MEPVTVDIFKNYNESRSAFQSPVVYRDPNNESSDNESASGVYHSTASVQSGKALNLFQFERNLPKLERAWPPPPEQVRALNRGAESMTTIRVVDDNGNRIPDVEIVACYQLHDFVKDTISKMTDNNGEAVFSSGKGSFVTFRISKAGYHSSLYDYNLFEPGSHCVEQGRWLPWNPTLVMMIKKRMEPCKPIVVKKLVTFPLDEPIAFDFRHGDLLPPYGAGKETNAVFVASGDDTSEGQCLPLRVTMTEGCQIMRCVKDAFSDYPYCTRPPSGEYAAGVSTSDVVSDSNRRTKDGILFPDEYYIVKINVLSPDGTSSTEYALVTTGFPLGIQEETRQASLFLRYYLFRPPESKSLESSVNLL